jgi:hypothetical protein
MGSSKAWRIHLAQGLRACFIVHPVNEQNTFKMVVFVLDGARQQAIRLEFDNLIFQASGFHPDRLAPPSIPPACVCG